MNILCINNSSYPRHASLIGRALQDHGHTVATCESILEAAELFQHHPYDAIICDYDFGLGMDGVDFLKELRIHGNKTPFVLYCEEHEFPCGHELSFKNSAVVNKKSPFEVLSGAINDLTKE